MKIFFPYREKYTIKDLKLEKEKNKNYTIDDIELKDENYEIPPLNEKLKNSLKKYSNINPLNNNNDNYLNSDINTNQPRYDKYIYSIIFIKWWFNGQKIYN